MDIYKFFNSKDVAEHCRNIGHKFNPYECAWIIDKSKRRTLSDKHKAYGEIIANFPDMELPGGKERWVRAYREEIHTLHHELALYVDCEKSVLEQFMQPEPGAVYRALAYIKLEHPYSPGSHKSNGVFSNFEKVYDNITKVMYEHNKYEDIAQYEYLSLYIVKEYADTGKSINASASLSGEITDIFTSGSHDIFEAGHLPFLLSHDIYIPVPFVRGDLVEDFEGTSRAYVFLNGCRDFRAQNLEDDGIGDKRVDGYTGENGYLYKGWIDNYYDLCYCKRKLKDEERILEFVSRYVKGTLPLEDLLKEYKSPTPDDEEDVDETSQGVMYWYTGG